MKMLARAGLGLSALSACLAGAPAAAQAGHATTSAAPAGYAPEVATVTVAATSTPLTGTATTSAATPTSGAASISNGVTTAGPFTPQLNRPIRVVLKLLAGTSYSAQLFTSPDGCTTLNQLTAYPYVLGSYAGATITINEDVDTPMISGIGYCLTITPASGATVSYAVRQ